MLFDSRTHRSRFARTWGVPARPLLVALQRTVCISWLTRVVDGVAHPARRSSVTTSGDRMIEKCVQPMLLRPKHGAASKGFSSQCQWRYEGVPETATLAKALDRTPHKQ